MSNTIIPKSSDVATKVPLVTDLEIGEVAINLVDGLVYFKDNTGAIRGITVATAPSIQVVEW